MTSRKAVWGLCPEGGGCGRDAHPGDPSHAREGWAERSCLPTGQPPLCEDVGGHVTDAGHHTASGPQFLLQVPVVGDSQ